MNTRKRRQSILTTTVAALLGLALSNSSSAGTLYWDGTSSTGNADGGAGSWNNNSNVNWNTLALGGASSAWLNTNPDNAVFGGTAGTVSLTSAITAGGIQFNTTGYTISGNTLTFGGTNNTVALNNAAAAAISSAIGTSAANMTFTALNPGTAGTITLGAAGGWTGTTTVNAGTTLQLNSASTAMLNTSGITLNGGTINQNYVAGVDRFNDSAAITSNGGTLSTLITSGTNVYADTVGAVTLERGLTTFVHSVNQAGAGTQTITLTSLVRNGTSAVNFASNGGLNITKNIMTVTGATATPTGQIIGAWATVGNTAGAFDYAVYDSSSRIVGANMAGTGQASWTVATDAYNNNVVAQTLGGTRTIAALRNTAATATLTLASGANLETYGVLNGAGSLFIIAPGTGGALSTPSGGGQLHLNAGNGTSGGAITVSAPINDNGVDAVTLVKNGLGTLTLSSTTSNFSGGIVLNGGGLTFNNNLNLGNGGGITVNGTASIDGGDQYTLARTLTLNDGALLTLGNGFGVTGVFSGNGALNVTTADDFIFAHASNTFTGAITSASSNNLGYGLKFNSIGDTAGAGLITLVGGSGTFHWMSASGSTTTLANRQFAISGTGQATISARGTTAASNLVINKDLLLTGTAGAKNLRLAGSNTGNNTFAGNITDGGASVVSLVKEEASTWILSGTNTHTGGTTVSAGILRIGNVAALPSNGNVTVTGGTLDSSVGAITAARYLASGGTYAASLAGTGDFYKYGTGTTTLSTSNNYGGGTVVAGGTLAVGASGTLGSDTAGNSITIRDAGILTLAALANSGSNQGISLSSSSKSGAPVSATGGGAGAVGRLAVLGLGFNGLPSGAISEANTLGGVIAINGITGYTTDLSTSLTSKNLFLGAIGTSTFTGAAGTVVAGDGSLYRLGGGGGTLTFNTANLFTSNNGVQVGSTFVNGGGTIVISAAQDYTGTTTVSAGTLTVSGVSGSATGSASFTLNGGRLFLDSGTNNNADRIGNVAVSLSNGSELSLNGNAAGTTEAFGDLNLGAGYSTVTATATTAASTLAGTGFARTNNGTALFRGTALGQNITAMGRVTLSDTAGLSFVGASTLANAANGDTTKDVRIVPYLIGATSGAGTGDTFVTYDTTHGFRVLNTTNQFNATVTADTNVRLAAAQTSIANTSINSLIIANTGSSTIADGATLTVTSGAVLFSAAGTIAPAGTTGILDFGSAEGVISAVSNGVISARITGSGGLTKSGTNSLTLSSAANSFSGGIIVNGGTLVAAVDGNLGGAANGITVNGHSSFSGGSVTYARSLTLNNGSVLTFTANASNTFSGNVTGTGGLAQNSGFGQQSFFRNLDAFEGPILIGSTGTTGQAYRMQFASGVVDSANANGRIVFSASSVTHKPEGSVFEYTGGTGGNTSLVLGNRQIELASQTGNPVNGHQIRNNSLGTGTLSINTDLIVSTPIAQTLALRGSNTGANTFGGIIGDGAGKVSLLKNDAGRWILSKANTFTGTTLVSGGTLELGHAQALQNSPLDATNSVTGTASVGLKTTVTTLTIGGLNGTKNLDTLFTTASGGAGGTTAKGGYNDVTALTLNPGTGQTTSYSGVIANGAADMTLTKTGAGAHILSGISTYTGATTVNAGALFVNGSISGSAATVNTGGTLSGSGTVGALTVSGGTLSPGTFIETLATGALSMNTSSTLAVELNSSVPTSSGADLLKVTGDFSLTGTANLSLDDIATTDVAFAQSTTFSLLNYTGTWNGGFFTVGGNELSDGEQFAAGLTIWEIDYNAGSGGVNFAGEYAGGSSFVNITAVPEPGAVMSLLAGLGVLTFMRRRRA